MTDTSEFSTPMMKQYRQVKKQNPDCLLFFRLGDFYELFMEDAKIGAHILGITLTKRHKGKDGDIPMAGVPYHAVDSYLSKLVKAGHKVAICEQTSEPDGKGIVQREVTRIVTPGTVLDEKTLERKENNYLISITLQKNILGLAYVDISTGDFEVNEVATHTLDQTLADELSRLNPAECILPESLYSNFQILRTLKKQRGLNIYCFYDWDIFADNAAEILKKQFAVTTLKGYGIADKPQALKAAAALLGYLKHTQKNRVNHLKSIHIAAKGNYVELDRSTILNLELFSTISDNEKKGTLIFHLDQTQTSMGARLLRQWLLQPLTNKEKIQERLDTVEFFFKERQLREDMRNLLHEVLDIERILSRLSVGIGNARDLVGLKVSLQKIVEIENILKTVIPDPLRLIISEASSIGDPENKNLDSLRQLADRGNDINVVIQLINQTIVDEPPIDIKQGGLIKSAINQELDDLRKIIGGGKQWIAQLEQQERIRTGINSLKIKFNSVFGFYIEISNANRDKIPADYTRKQTLVNAERFITPELKKQEELVLTAEEKINSLEYQLFVQTVNQVLTYTQLLQQTAKTIAQLDCLINFAHIAEKHNYVKPAVTDMGPTFINILGGRHPVVEQILEDVSFVPNDTVLNHTDQQLILISGPNMGGKSVYIRQTAIIILMAHLGSFVPAKEAQVSIVDRIFVRSGAADVMALGLSTFMVEMVETANILHHATSKSLIILDEIGRGTSTYDGLSIAWAVAEYLVSHHKNAPLTLFATHYHELQTLAEKYPKIRNFQVAVEQTKEELIFLHKVIPGGTSHSYGIAVAKLAGVPADVIHRALEVLKKLEDKPLKTPYHKIAISDIEQMSFLRDQKHPVIEELKKTDTDKMTPIEALNKLALLKEKL